MLTLPAARLLFPDPPDAIQIGVRPVGEHLREARDDVERVIRGRPVHRLPQPIPEPVVPEFVLIRPLRDAHKPVGMIVAVAAHAVREQVAVVVPDKRHTIHLDQPVGDVINVDV